MTTHGWMHYSKKILTLLTAMALLGLSACGDDDDSSGDNNGADNNGVDHCVDVTCEPPAASCQGNAVVTYSGAGVCDPEDGTCDFSEVAQLTECDSGEVCSNGQCIPDDADLCDGITCNDPPAASCEGTVAITYTGAGICQEASGTCDYSEVETRTDCADTAQECRDGGCVSVDPQTCDDITCEAPEDTCEGDVAVTYTGDGTCNEDDLSCDFSQVETRTDCAASGEVCQQGACVPEGTDPCESQTCEQPEDTCDGNTAVTYSDAGVCDSTDGSCDFSSVETRTDCGATSQVCQEGACVDPAGDDHSVNPGDLVITEFMADPATVSDSNGEYFEVYNTTDRVLHLNGLTIYDDGSDSFVVTHPSDDPIAVAPHSYFVFGNNADSDINGGLTIDYAYSGMTLANTDDEIIIARDLGGSEEAEIARVEYGPATDFPSKAAGISAQLGAEHGFNGIDNNDGTLWCHSRDAISSTNPDLGTPGAPNVDCALPTATVTIQDLQDESSPDHPVPGTPVIINGVTITALSDDDAWAQDPAGGPYSGIYLNVRSSDTDLLQVGDVVDITGTYTEAYSVTTIDTPVFTIQSSGAAPAPEVVSSSVFADPTSAEPWEGVLIRIAKPGVTNENPDAPDNHGEFRIDATLRVDEQLYDFNAAGHQPTNCDTFEQLSGVVHYTFGNYKLLPRDAADLPAPGALDISVDNEVEAASFGLSPKDICVLAGTEVHWSAGTGGGKELIESDPLTGDALASPNFTGYVGATSGLSHTFDQAGTLHYRAETNTGTLIDNGRVIVLEAP